MTTDQWHYRRDGGGGDNGGGRIRSGGGGVPQVLRQKCHVVEGSSHKLLPTETTSTRRQGRMDQGGILTWKGLETGYFWTRRPSGDAITIFRYPAAGATAMPSAPGGGKSTVTSASAIDETMVEPRVHLEFDFGPMSEVIDAVYFPLGHDRPGVVVALADGAASALHRNQLAYFSLQGGRGRGLVKRIWLPHPITCLHSVVDGISAAEELPKLIESFRVGWPHILLVGCKLGYAYLTHLDIGYPAAEGNKGGKGGEDVLSDVEPDDDENYQNEQEAANSRGRGRKKKLAHDDEAMVPVQYKKLSPLSRIYHQDRQFLFQADDGSTKCLDKQWVRVTSLTYIERAHLVIIGFNFGGVQAISLVNSKVYTPYLETRGNGEVVGFAIQEPEEEPRPMLFLWILIRLSVSQIPTYCYSALLFQISFPKDEAIVDPSQWTFADPLFGKLAEWNVCMEPTCGRMLSMRTIKRRAPPTNSTSSSNDEQNNGSRVEGELNNDNSSSFSSSSTSFYSLNSSSAGVAKKRQPVVYDTSLMLMVWEESPISRLHRSNSQSRNGGKGDAARHIRESSLSRQPRQPLQSLQPRLRGALFDLNAFYAKRLIWSLTPDNTVARQLPFISHFTAVENFPGSGAERILDMMAVSVSRFAPSAALRAERIDQLFYPSAYSLTAICLSDSTFCRARVPSIQVQVLLELERGLTSRYFDDPHEACRCAHAVGLANTAPTTLTEKRTCLLRIFTNNYFPAVMRLVRSCHTIDAAAAASAEPGRQDEEMMKEASKKGADRLHFISKWAWKEVELTRVRFDELCGPILEGMVADVSPSARAYILHARVLFKRAAVLIQAALNGLDTGDRPALVDDDPESTVANVTTTAAWRTTLDLRLVATRQVQLFAAGVALVLSYRLSPRGDPALTDAYRRCAEAIRSRASAITTKCKGRKGKAIVKGLEAHAIVAAMMALNPGAECWAGRDPRAEEWYPPAHLIELLPCLLLVNVSEISKMTLLGHYLLDLEQQLRRPEGRRWPRGERHLREGLFGKAMSFLMQEEFSLEDVSKIARLWRDECRLAELDEDSIRTLAMVAGPTRGTRNNRTERERDEELARLPLTSREEVAYAREQFTKCWGQEMAAYKFNANVIAKRRFHLLMELPTNPTGREPAWALQCRAECARLRQQMPWLFNRHHYTLPEPVVTRFLANVREEFAGAAARQREPAGVMQLGDSQLGASAASGARKRPLQQLHPTVQPAIQRDSMLPSTAEGRRRSTLVGKRHSMALEQMPMAAARLAGPQLRALEEEVEEMEEEELPLVNATPTAKRQRLMLFPGTPMVTQRYGQGAPISTPLTSANRRQYGIKRREWDRIAKVTRMTPLPRRTTQEPAITTPLFPGLRREGGSPGPGCSGQPAPVSATPLSILKSSTTRDPHHSRLNPERGKGAADAKPHLRFAPNEILTVEEAIPTNAENREAESLAQKDTSFGQLSQSSGNNTTTSTTVRSSSDNETTPRPALPLSPSAFFTTPIMEQQPEIDEGEEREEEEEIEPEEREMEGNAYEDDDEYEDAAEAVDMEEPLEEEDELGEENEEREEEDNDTERTSTTTLNPLVAIASPERTFFEEQEWEEGDEEGKEENAVASAAGGARSQGKDDEVVPPPPPPPPAAMEVGEGGDEMEEEEGDLVLGEESATIDADETAIAEETEKVARVEITETVAAARYAVVEEVAAAAETTSNSNSSSSRLLDTTFVVATATSTSTFTAPVAAEAKRKVDQRQRRYREEEEEKDEEDETRTGGDDSGGGGDGSDVGLSGPAREWVTSHLRRSERLHKTTSATTATTTRLATSATTTNPTAGSARKWTPMQMKSTMQPTSSTHQPTPRPSVESGSATAHSWRATTTSPTKQPPSVTSTTSSNAATAPSSHSLKDLMSRRTTAASKETTTSTSSTRSTRSHPAMEKREEEKDGEEYEEEPTIPSSPVAAAMERHSSPRTSARLAEQRTPTKSIASTPVKRKVPGGASAPVEKEVVAAAGGVDGVATGGKGRGRSATPTPKKKATEQVKPRTRSITPKKRTAAAAATTSEASKNSSPGVKEEEEGDGSSSPTKKERGRGKATSPTTTKKVAVLRKGRAAARTTTVASAARRTAEEKEDGDGDREEEGKSSSPPPSARTRSRSRSATPKKRGTTSASAGKQ